MEEQANKVDCVYVNEYWRVIKSGPRLFSARSKHEYRICFCRDALERDFGAITFPSEQTNVSGGLNGMKEKEK